MFGLGIWELVVLLAVLILPIMFLVVIYLVVRFAVKRGNGNKKISRD